MSAHSRLGELERWPSVLDLRLTIHPVRFYFERRARHLNTAHGGYESTPCLAHCSRVGREKSIGNFESQAARSRW